MITKTTLFTSLSALLITVIFIQTHLTSCSHILPKKEHSSGVLKKVLNKTVNILENASIEYSLAYGTLLGMYRDHAPIEKDDDIDIFIPSSHWEKAVYEMKKKFPLAPMPLNNPYFRCFIVDCVQVDLYQLTFYKNRCIDCWEHDVFQKNEIYPFKRYGKYYVPKNVELFLEMVYGRDWKIPKKGKLSFKREQSLARRVCQKSWLSWYSILLLVVLLSFIVF
jgi:hypothetical protein